MAKVFETFKHDIKRKFDDVMTVEDSDSRLLILKNMF